MYVCRPHLVSSYTCTVWYPVQTSFLAYYASCRTNENFEIHSLFTFIQLKMQCFLDFKSWFVWNLVWHRNPFIRFMFLTVSFRTWSLVCWATLVSANSAASSAFSVSSIYATNPGFKGFLGSLYFLSYEPKQIPLPYSSETSVTRFSSVQFYMKWIFR